MCRLHLFVLDSHLATLWESNCPFGFLLVMFSLGSSYFVFVFLSLWCLWWEVWDNCIDSWPLPSLLFVLSLWLLAYFTAFRVQVVAQTRFLSLLATASRLFAIAWGFTSGFSSQLFMRIFIRALLLNQTQCGTITVNWMWSSGILYGFFISLT